MREVKVLIVEDEIIVAMDLQARLRRLGYTVVGVACSGEEALHKATKTTPDVVLMDIVLKGLLDGIETAKHLRMRLPVPIIYVTAYTDEATVERMKLTDYAGYLFKPFDEPELRATIERALISANSSNSPTGEPAAG